MVKKNLLSLLFLCAMAAAGFPRIGALAATTDDLPQGRRGTLYWGQTMDNNYGSLDNFGMLSNNYGTVYNNNLLTKNYGLVSNIRRVDEYFRFILLFHENKTIFPARFVLRSSLATAVKLSASYRRSSIMHMAAFSGQQGRNFRTIRAPIHRVLSPIL